MRVWLTALFILMSLFAGLESVRAQTLCRQALRPPSSELRLEIERVLDAAVQRGDFKDLIFEVRDLKGRVLFEKNLGEFGRGDVLPVLSASKWVSAAAIMKLVEEGVLRLEDPVSKYITRPGGSAYPEAIGAIRLRELLSFTSGLGGGNDAFLRTDVALEPAVHELLMSTDPAVQAGRFFDYHDNHLQVASLMAVRALERRTGAPESWARIVSERLGGPLGLGDLEFFAKPRKRQGAENPRAAAGLRISFEGYSRFLRMIAAGGVFEGRRVLSGVSVREMERDQFGPATRTRIDGVIAPEAAKRYGLGQWIESRDGGASHERSSGGYAGWLPVLNRERGFTAMIGANEKDAASDRAEALWSELRPLVEQLRLNEE